MSSHFRIRSTASAPPDTLPRLAANRSRLHAKYANVKPSVDSGLNMLKVIEKFPESKINARFKKVVSFRQIKPTTLARFLTKAEEKVECLLLDVRDRDSYNACHLKKAISFPAQTLKKSVNIFPREILEFINKEPKKIIVFYDDNEFSAMRTGNLFVEKGVDNIFMLSGGLEEMCSKYPELIQGQVTFTSPFSSRPRTPSLRSEPFR